MVNPVLVGVNQGLLVWKRRGKEEEKGRVIGIGGERVRDGEFAEGRSEGGFPATGKPADEVVIVAAEERREVAGGGGGGGDEAGDGGDEGGGRGRGRVVGERRGEERETAEEEAFDVAGRRREAVDYGG